MQQRRSLPLQNMKTYQQAQVKPFLTDCCLKSFMLRRLSHQLSYHATIACCLFEPATYALSAICGNQSISQFSKWKQCHCHLPVDALHASLNILWIIFITLCSKPHSCSGKRKSSLNNLARYLVLFCMNFPLLSMLATCLCL